MVVALFRPLVAATLLVATLLAQLAAILIALARVTVVALPTLVLPG
jgi:hypothetical protein